MARTLTLLFLLSFSLFSQLPTTSTSGGSSNAASGTGTTNTLSKFTGTSTIGNSTITDDGTKISLGENSSIGANAITQSYTNANPGTVVNTLTKINSSRNVLKTTITDTANIYGICLSGCGNSSTAQIAFAGQAACVFDNQTVVNDFVIGSTSVAGDCHDGGNTEPSVVQVIGRVVSLNSGAATNAIVDLFTPDTINASPVIKSVASGTVALGTSAISSAACATAVTSTATGTLTTDILTVSFNSDPTAVTGYTPVTTGNLTIYAYPTANTANFKVCNTTTASITPGAVTLNWKVVR